MRPWDELRDASREQLAVRAAIVVATVVFVLAATAAAGTWVWDPWLMLVPVVLAIVVAVVPHGALPALLLLYLVWQWVGAAQSSGAWAQLGAACMLTAQLAAALAASVPPPARLPAGLWRRYLPRLAAVYGAAVLVWGLVALVTAAGSGGVTAMLIGLTAVLAAVLWHYRWSERVGADRTEGR